MIPALSLEILIILTLIVANGIFAMSEIAIISSSKARLENRINEGEQGARVALELANEPTQLLSTIQIGITLIGIFTGAFGGNTIARHLSVQLSKVPLLASFSEAISLMVVVSVITYLSLIIGELVPKRLALNSPEALASFLSRPMRIFSKIASPAVYFLVLSTNIVLKFLGVKPSQEPSVTEDEIKILIRQGAEAGTFEKMEEDMVEQVFRLGDLRVDALITPRTQIVWLDLEDDLYYNLKIINESIHSRFPVGRGSLDDLVGIVHTRDLFSFVLEKGDVNLGKCARAPLFIPESIKVFKVLELFKQSGIHEAMVLDEYGGIIGLVTLHDILEEIVGDMPMPNDQSDPQIVQREDGSWLLDGMLPIDDFKDFFNVDKLPDEDDGSYYTLGGFVTTYLGNLPKVSESFEWEGLRFEIIDMDRARVDKILVISLQEELDNV